ncbi:MAG: sugar ABC transporter permease [Trueperaceae bacterium]
MAVDNIATRELPAARRRRKWGEILVPYLLVSPAILFVAGVLGYAVVNGFVTSLFRVDIWTIGRPFVGLGNYLALFRDPNFLNSLTRSLIFVAGTIVFGLALSMTYALLLQAVRSARGFLRSVALIPYLVSGIAAAIMWRFLFTGEASLVQATLESLGFGQMTWLGHPDRALAVVTLANVWFISPFATLILLGGLQSVDQQLYDAAAIDGANWFHSFLNVTLPGILPMLSLSLMWLSFASFNMFDIILPLTGGGPGRSTEVLAVYMYQLAFRNLDYSSASAVMMVLLVINLTLSLLYLRVSRVR